MKISNNTGCDNTVIVNAVQGFVAARAEGKGKEFCEEYLLNHKVLTKVNRDIKKNYIAKILHKTL